MSWSWGPASSAHRPRTICPASEIDPSRWSTGVRSAAAGPSRRRRDGRSRGPRYESRPATRRCPAPPPRDANGASRSTPRRVRLRRAGRLVGRSVRHHPGLEPDRRSRSGPGGTLSDLWVLGARLQARTRARALRRADARGLGAGCRPLAVPLRAVRGWRAPGRILRDRIDLVEGWKKRRRP